MGEDIKDLDQDVEGHGGINRKATDEDDVEGHGGINRKATDEDDVEGHSWKR